ncbi:MAG: prepilin-type N-terminal cleavage/methylation domain-containing protein [Deltaproteobacteria bacterium]|nr:prepilin-type N-terminal cleavage/methylation domain-containing protein [Deltaproteobacteria bacterium]
MITEQHRDRLRVKCTEGFTLIEVMVVMVIVAIIATGVVFMFANPTAKIKTQAFELLGEINYARAVSVTENQTVTVEFFPVIGAADSYWICIDADPAGGNGDCSDTNDEILKDITLRNDVQFYDFSDGTTPPTLPDGPDLTPPYASAPPTGADLTSSPNNDGITFATLTTDNVLMMYPDGTCNTDGAAVIYLYSGSDRSSVRGSPYAVVIDNASSCQAKLSRWRSELTDLVGTSYDERWSRK